MSRIGSIPITGGVPLMSWRIPVAGSYSGQVGERGRAGPAVEVLVGAADGDVHAVGVQVQRHRARGVAQVPQDERPGVVHDARDRGEVRDVPRLVGDVAEQDQGGVRPDGGGHVLRRHARLGVRRDPAELQAALGGDALQHEPVGGEVLGVGDDHAAPGARVDRGAGELVEQHRRRVGDDGLPRRRAQHHAAEGVAELGRRVHPALVPGPDQARRPRPVDEGGEPLARGGQRPAQRVAVQVGDQALARGEAVAVAGERVAGVERGRAFAQCGGQVHGQGGGRGGDCHEGSRSIGFGPSVRPAQPRAEPGSGVGPLTPQPHHQ
jgi:hypothetical protein